MAEKPQICEIQVTYCQEADSGSSGDNFLRIHMEDGGGGPYAVLSSERWAIDVGEESHITALVQEVASMVEGRWFP